MLKCAPYIKSLCSSLHSGWWRDGTSSLPGSPIRHPVTLPSPTRSENAAGLAFGAHDFSKSENHIPSGDECIDYDNLYIVNPITKQLGQNITEAHSDTNLVITQTPQQNDLADVKLNSLLSPPQPSSTANASTAVVSISGNGEIVTSVIVNQPQSSLHNKPSSSVRHQDMQSSPPVKSDLIHVLKKIRPESPDVTRAAKKLEMARRLGAISKIPKQQQYGCKDNTPPNSPSRRYSQK